MNVRTFTVSGIAGALALFAFAGAILFMAASARLSRSAGPDGLSKAMQRQTAWLASARDFPNPPAVDPEYTGKTPQEMARCLKADSVLSHATGLINKPNPKFGISPGVRKTVNDAVSSALGRIAAVEKDSMSMVPGKSSDLFTRYLLPPNAEVIEQELGKLDQVAHQVLSKEVAAGLMLTLRETAAFRSYQKQWFVTMSASGDGLAGAAPSTDQSGETDALKVRWGHLANSGKSQGVRNPENRSVPVFDDKGPFLKGIFEERIYQDR